MSSRTTVQINAIAVLLLTLLTAPGCSFSSDTPDSPHESLRKARLLLARGDANAAESLVRPITLTQPHLADAWLLAAECAVARNAYDDAVDYLSHIPADNEKAWLTAQMLTADILHYELYRFRDAEKTYRGILQIDPDNVTANDGYARLLGMCGRRSEAIPCVLRLILAEQETDLLMLLSRESGLLNDPQMLKAAIDADSGDPNPLFGQAAAAAASQQPKLALEKLEAAEKLGHLPAEFTGWMGRQLLSNGQTQRLRKWQSELDMSQLDAESWLILAELADAAGDVRSTVRCAWEASRRRPESLPAMHQLARSLTSVNESQLAEPLLQRVQLLNDLRDLQHQALMADRDPNEQEFLDMLTALRSVGRYWEALAWGRIGVKKAPQNDSMQQLVKEMTEQLPDLKFQLTAEEFNLAAKLDLSEYPMPTTQPQIAEPVGSLRSDNVAFRMQAADIGFQFEYMPGAITTTHRMLEFGGGGLAAADFDNDGYADLLCTQGTTIPNAPATETLYHDTIFRNLRGERFDDVSQAAGFGHEKDFSTGVSAGDINNDGFADAYIASIGANSLWLNNGDGTFSAASVNVTDAPPEWTASCLIADLNGDSIPDLYDVNYLTGHDVFTRVCSGGDEQQAMCTPYDYPGAMDRCLMGTGDGSYQDKTASFLTPPPAAGRGLGVAAFRSGSGGLSLFVANDTVANFFYTSNSTTPLSLIDNAAVAGLAFNAAGAAEACMGVAVADCTQDGNIDLLVTNFLYESNTLYSLVAPGLYEDQTRKLGLQDASLPVLGFGTQFLDANLDGRQELFVANGHTSDQSRQGTAFQMQPHMFEWTGSQFEQLNSDIIGQWSRQKFVGRAVAKIDWNRDGRPDLAVGLLREPSFVLTNTSNTDGNHFLIIQLISTQNARDAIGTIVKVKTPDGTQTVQLTGGDGYQCTNQRQIQIGIGQHKVIEAIEINWPSGRTQTFSDVPSDSHIAIAEGRQYATLPN